MKCQSCNADLKENARFCEFCGTPVQEPTAEQPPVQQPPVQQPPVQQPPVQQPPVQQPPVQQPPVQQQLTQPTKKKNTSAIIIAVLLVVIIALGVGFFVLLNNKNDDKDKTKEKDSRTEKTSETSEQNTEAPPKTPSYLVADENDKNRFENFMGWFIDGCMGNFESSKETTATAIESVVFDGVGLPAYWAYFEEPYMGEDGYIYPGQIDYKKTPDPLNRFDSENTYTYFKLEESDVKWIVENCSGVKYSVVTDFGEPTEDDYSFEVSNKNAYYYNGYYYFCPPGGVGGESGLINVNYSMDSNGIYTITAELYNAMSEETVVFCTYKAELIEADGKHVWRMISSQFDMP